VDEGMSSQMGMVGTLGSSTALGAFGVCAESEFRARWGFRACFLLPLVWVYGRNAKGVVNPDSVRGVSR